LKYLPTHDKSKRIKVNDKSKRIKVNDKSKRIKVNNNSKRIRVDDKSTNSSTRVDNPADSEVSDSEVSDSEVSDLEVSDSEGSDSGSELMNARKKRKHEERSVKAVYRDDGDEEEAIFGTIRDAQEWLQSRSTKTVSYHTVYNCCNSNVKNKLYPAMVQGVKLFFLKAK
jgi:hypothetical protein